MRPPVASPNQRQSGPENPKHIEPMKNAFHIKRDFPGTSTRTFGMRNCYTCEVKLADGSEVKGMGTTLESAEDTAWHTLRETVTG